MDRRMERVIAVVGGANLDVGAKFAGAELDGDSNNGYVSFYPGGVGRNIAEDLALLGCRVKLLTAIADDYAGAVIRKNAEERGIELLCGPVREDGSITGEPGETGGAGGIGGARGTSGAGENAGKCRAVRTGSYVYFVKSSGEFEVGINDMEITARLSPEFVGRKKAELMAADMVVIDANIPEETIEMICGMGKKVVADCVSATKCVRLKGVLDNLYLIKANRYEAAVLTGESDTEKQVRRFIELGLEKGIITLGSEGALCFAKQGKETTIYKIGTPKAGTLPGRTTVETAKTAEIAESAESVEIVDTSGCGDAFLAGFLTALVNESGTEEATCFEKALCYGEAAAIINAQSATSVNFEGLNFADVRVFAQEMLKDVYAEQIC